MEVTAIVCPQCGGRLNAPEGTTRCFCSFCGTELHLDDGSRTITYIVRDEAGIKRAEVDDNIDRRKSFMRIFPICVSAVLFVGSIVGGIVTWAILAPASASDRSAHFTGFATGLISFFMFTLALGGVMKWFQSDDAQ